MGRDPASVGEAIWEAWPERAVAKSGEPKAKRMRPDVTFGEQENPAEPGPERPAAKQQERGKLLHIGRDDLSSIGARS